MPTTRHIEIDGAINHPLCNGPRRIADAVYIADCRSYHDDTDRARAFIAYCVRNGITEPLVRADMGQTFGGVFTDANCPLYAQEPAADLAAGYASGCLNYRKRVLMGTWAGCEFERFCHIMDLLVVAGLRPIVMFNLLGEAVLDLWGADPATSLGQRVIGVLTLLNASPRAIARNGGKAIPVDNPRENWTGAYRYLRGVMSTTCARIMEDSPVFDRPFMVSNACAVEIIRDDGRLQPASEMMNNQISHAGAYATSDAATGACIDAKHRHAPGHADGWPGSDETIPYALNLDLEDCTAAQVAARDRFGAAEHSIIWGNVADLVKLDALAGAIAAMGERGGN